MYGLPKKEVCDRVGFGQLPYWSKDTTFVTDFIPLPLLTGKSSLLPALPQSF